MKRAAREAATILTELAGMSLATQPADNPHRTNPNFPGRPVCDECTPIIITGQPGESTEIKGDFPMARKTTTELQKTEIQALAETLADKLDWPGLEAIVPLGLAVLQRLTRKQGLNPNLCYTIDELAEMWDWNPRYLQQRLEEDGIPIYQVGDKNKPFVHFRDIMEAPKCLRQTKSKSTRSRKKDESTGTTGGKT